MTKDSLFIVNKMIIIDKRRSYNILYYNVFFICLTCVIINYILTE